MENHLQRVMRKCRNQQERLRIQKARLRKQQVRLLEARVERVGGETPCHAGVVTGKPNLICRGKNQAGLILPGRAVAQ